MRATFLFLPFLSACGKPPVAEPREPVEKPTQRSRLAPGLAFRTARDAPPDDIAIGFTDNVEVGGFVFRSETLYVINALTLSNCLTDEPDYDGDCADAGETPGNDDATVIIGLEYTNLDGDSVVAYAIPSGGKAEYSDLGLRVGFRPSEVRVIADISSVSSTGVDSGVEFRWNMVVTTDAPFEAINLTTGTAYTEATARAYIPGARMTVRKTEPTFGPASGSPSGERPSGFDEVFRYNVAANAHGYVGLSSVLFGITSTDDGSSGWNACSSFGDPDKWDVVNNDDWSESLRDDVSFYSVDGTACEDAPTATLGYVRINFPDDEEIGAGSTNTYVLEADSTGAGVDDSLRVDIVDQEEAEAIDLETSVAWEDDAEADVNDASYLESLPVIGSPLVFTGP